ncbi:spore maturation protein [Mycoplasmatota bacterium]|nr:spore maturation protein [Mycoplasmatota bacterium]
MNISYYVLPLYIFIIMLFTVKKINAFDSFIEGCKDGIRLIMKIFPVYLAMLFAVKVFVGSNILNDTFQFLKFNLINSDLILQGIMRPISGSASLSVMTNIFEKYGVDSVIGICSSIIQGSTDTTIFVITLYFGSIGVTKYRYALKLGLLVDLIGFIVSLLLVYVIML